MPYGTTEQTVRTDRATARVHCAVGVLSNASTSGNTVHDPLNNPDGSLTVNALHVKFIGGTGGDVILSSATCGPASLPVPMISVAGGVAAGGLTVLGLAGV